MSTTIKYFCPECGEFYSSLDRRTGWCRACASSINKNSPDCIVCGRLKDIKLGCTYCKLEQFLERNADHLEHYLMQGHSLAKALKLLREEVKPVCLSCGAVMNRARRDSVFCHRTDRCVKAVRRYNYLCYDKGKSKSEALAIVLESLNGSD